MERSSRFRYDLARVTSFFMVVLSSAAETYGSSARVLTREGFSIGKDMVMHVAFIDARKPLRSTP
jgi:hypothetical protein